MNTKSRHAMPKFPKLIGLIFFVFCVNLPSLHAQEDTCLRFEDLPPNAIYGKNSGHAPGDLAFSSQGVNVYLQEFLYSNSNETGFFNASVETDLFGEQPATNGQSLFISNINLVFDFSTLQQAVNGVCFNIVDGGGEENIAVNGAPIKILPDFSDVPTEIAPGVFLSVTPIQNTGGFNLNNAQVCIRGKIETLTIGGQEFALDNLCYYYEPCGITDLKAEIVNCEYINEEVYVYELDIDFSLQSTNNISFDLFINGSSRGFYSTADLPIRIKQIRVLSTTQDFEIKVCANDRPDCCMRIELPNKGCSPNCSLEDVAIGEIECGFDGFYYTNITTKGTNLSGKITITNEVGETWTGPADGSERVKFPTPDQQYDKWVVCDSTNPDCCFTLDFDVPCTSCRIGPLQVTTSDCADDGTFYYLLDFDHLSVSGEFSVFVEDIAFAFNYENLPVRVGPFLGDGTTKRNLLVLDGTGQCERDIDLNPVDCKPSNCEIGPLEISEPDCTPNGIFYFKLDFEHKNTSDVFKLYLNGDLYEQYAYQSLPVQVGPLTADGTTDWHILVEDLSGLCQEDTKLEAVNCNPTECAIGDLKLSEPICTDDGQFYFELNFEHQNTSGKFLLYLNEDLYESYAYEDLPIKVGPLAANADQDWQVLVRDAESNSIDFCASDAKLPAVNCQGDKCEIGALKISNPVCTDDGQYFSIQLNFEHENTAEKFQLFLNQELYGTFAYNELPINVGPLNALIDIEWQLLVKDASGDCAEDINFSAPNCNGNQECKLTNLQVERYPCVGGQFLVDLFFDIKDPGPLGFYVFANGKISGPHPYNQPFITLGPFPGDGTTTNDFLVIDIEDPACFGYYELAPVDCSNPCTIGEVFAEAHECDADGGFMVDIEFKYDKVGGSGFTIRGNDVDYGKFEYGKPFYTIGPLKGDGTTAYEFEIIDNDNPDCRNFTTIAPVNCLPPCSIGELEYTVQCLENAKKFVINLDFEYENPESDLFVLSIADEIIGTFPYTDLPLSQELALPEDGNLIVVVWDAKNEDCAQKAQFLIPCCYLSDPIIEAHPCENDGELWIDLDAKYYNTSETFQLVYGLAGGDMRTKIVAYSDLPLTLGPLPGQATEDWYFEITDQGFYCQSSTYFGPDYCDDDACAEWDQATLGAYGPLTGYQPGDEIAQEDDIRLSFAPNNQPDCNCSVFLMKASTFPAFSEASGQLVLLDNSGALISAPGYEILSLSVDYYFTGNEALLKINGEEIVAAVKPTDFPEDIAPGVNLKVTPNSNDGRRGTMLFTGKIQGLTFISRGQWALDNFCTDKAEKEEAVWPGDTNLDNVANHIDLLNIGLGFGEQGSPRTTVNNISWEAQQSEDWPDFFFDNGLNLKHADADGDGTISRADRAPILENYGLSHGPLPVFAQVPTTDNDPPLYVDFEGSGTPIPTGGTFQVPIIFGTETQAVEDIYGLAFSIIFDPEVINPASIEVVYPDSWLGDTEKNLLTLDRTLEAGGRIDVALTRIDKENVGGFGAIASLIGAIDDIAGKHTEIGITEVVAITANENRIPVNGITTKVEFSENVKPDVGYIDINASLNIFPNPTVKEVIVTTKFNFPIEGIRVLDGYGNPTGLQVQGQNRINLESLPSGVYMLRIQLGEYTVSRKVVKVN